LGLQFPDDFRDFIFAYGSGALADFFYVFNPFSADVTGGLPGIRNHCDVLRMHKGDDEDHVPFPIFPETGGLLPWGSDANGNGYCWLTKGNPAQWVTLRNQESCAPWKRFRYPITTFLAKVLGNKLPEFWGKPKQEFRREQLVFKSYSE